MTDSLDEDGNTWHLYLWLDDLDWRSPAIWGHATPSLLAIVSHCSSALNGLADDREIILGSVNRVAQQRGGSGREGTCSDMRAGLTVP
jgi:hypothetical protein